MNQLLLRLQPGVDREIRPSELRGIVAALDREAPTLFARDENGRTVPRPAARFIGGRSWVGVLVDEDHSHLLMRHAGEIILAVSKHVGQPVPVEFEQHPHGLVKTQSVWHYRALNVAIKRRGPAPRTAVIEELLARRIAGSIQIQAEHMGADVPDENELEIACVEIDRTVGMQLKTDKGLTNEWVTVIPSVSFTSFVDLKGFWFVGNLSARGHGRIVRQRALTSSGSKS